MPWLVDRVTDDGYRVAFTATPDNGEPVDFLIDVPAGRPVVTDAMGRRLTRSGVWLTPVVEINGEWAPRGEDPTDPWQRTEQPRDVPAAIEAACAAWEARRAGT